MRNCKSATPPDADSPLTVCAASSRFPCAPNWRYSKAMAHEAPPARPDDSPDASAPSDTRAELAMLTERVTHLEHEMSLLRQATAAPASPRPHAYQPPPPPPAVYTPFPPPPPVAPARAAAFAFHTQPVPTRESFENRLGSQIFNRIGIVLLIVGTAWFFKLAVDRHWIVPTPMGRVVAGLLAGAGIILWSERFRRKGYAAFSYSLKALGSGVLYLTLWAAFQLFHLLPAPAAFVLMVAVTAWNAWMAWSQDSELLASYALIGGFLTPRLLSTGGDHEVFEFSYLLALDLAVILLVRLKPWPRLLLGAFPGTVAFFILWYTNFFTPEALTVTTLFILAFDCTFSSVPIRRVDPTAAPRGRFGALLEDILLPLANASFLSLALYSVLQDSGHHALLPWLMVALAAVYLAFMRLPQSRTASAIHLAIAIVFLTIAIPLKASGHWITVSWLIEGLALLWTSTRLSSQPSAQTGLPPAPPPNREDAYAADTMRLLALATLILGFFNIVFQQLIRSFERDPGFFTISTMTALIGVAVYAGVTWIALRQPTQTPTHGRGMSFALRLSLFAIAGIAFLLTWRDLLTAGLLDTYRYRQHPAFASPDFFTALLGLSLFAGLIAASLRLARARPHSDATLWPTTAAASTVAFNLLAVLIGLREISAIWANSPATDPDAVLQHSLAVSAFLMLYGAALLAIGFWRRSAFLRWQALILLTFTILKTFLYDMRSLSQGYRVVSFMGLGAVLMAISFAYQKDWLGLREPAPAPPGPEPPV
jgi:uncharacterized membrane protein